MLRFHKRAKSIICLCSLFFFNFSPSFYIQMIFVRSYIFALNIEGKKLHNPLMLRNINTTTNFHEY